MQYTLEPQLKELSQLERHHFLGRNCYQHAIDYQGVILSLSWEKQFRCESQMSTLPRPLEILGYVSLLPGRTHERLAFVSMNALTARDVDDLVMQGCAEDKLELYTGPASSLPATTRDQRTLALYLRERGRGDCAAFHFIRQNEDKTWEGRFPGQLAETYASPPREIESYRFARFFVLPVQGELPLGLSTLNPITTSYQASDKSNICFHMVAPDATLFQNQIFVNCRANFAALGVPSSALSQHLSIPELSPELEQALGRPPKPEIYRTRPQLSPMQVAAASWKSLGFF